MQLDEKAAFMVGAVVAAVTTWMALQFSPFGPWLQDDPLEATQSSAAWTFRPSGNRCIIANENANEKEKHWQK
jgi:hypothetical protein